MPEYSNDQFFSEYVIDPSTGQTIRLPTAMGFGMGLAQAQPPPDEVYPPESGGAAPPIDHGSLWQQPTIPQTVIDTANREAATRARAALPANVRNGSYDTSDNADFPEPAQPMFAQRGGMSLGPRGSDVAHFTQSTGPLGTIDQIGQAYARDPYGRSPQGQYATQADLDGALFDQQTAIPSLPQPRAYDPNQPEQAGADLYAQSLGMQERAVQASAQADARQAAAESRARAAAAVREQAIQEQAARERAATEARFQQAKADVERKTDSWVSYHVDPHRRWHQASTGEKIGVAISVAMSALGDALQYKSGPNGALQIINSANEDDVNAQIDERQQLGDAANRARSSLDDYQREFGDLALAKQAKLAENEKRLANEIQQQTATVNGQKARATTLATVATLRSQAAEREQNIAMTVFNRREQQRQNQAQLGVSYANLKLNRDQFTWQKDQQQQQLDLEAKKIAATGNGKAAQQVSELGLAAPPTTAVDKDGNVSVQRGGVLTNSDGTPFTAPTKEEAIEARKKVGAANNLVAVMDEIRAIRDRAGGQSSWGNSDDYQRLQVLKNNLVLLKKAGTQGMSSDEDMNKLISALGAKDPASFRSQMAGLDEGRRQVVNQINSDLHTQYGYSGADLDWADPVKSAKPQNDEQFKSLLSDAMDVATRDADAETKLIKDLGIEKEMGKTLGGERITVLRNALDAAGDMSPSQRQVLEGYASTIADPNTGKQERDRALEHLSTASTSSKSKGVKTYARQLLAANATTGAQTSRDTPESLEQPYTSVAHDIPAGGPATTMSGQIANEQMRANALKAMPLVHLLDAVNKGDTQAISELSQRAMRSNADPATKGAYMRWIGSRK